MLGILVSPKINIVGVGSSDASESPEMIGIRDLASHINKSKSSYTEMDQDNSPAILSAFFLKLIFKWPKSKKTTSEMLRRNQQGLPASPATAADNNGCRQQVPTTGTDNGYHRRAPAMLPHVNRLSNKPIRLVSSILKLTTPRQL